LFLFLAAILEDRPPFLLGLDRDAGVLSFFSFLLEWVMLAAISFLGIQSPAAKRGLLP